MTVMTQRRAVRAGMARHVMSAMAACALCSPAAADADWRTEGTVIEIDGDGVGAIPDGPGTPNLCGTFGTPLNIVFHVPDLGGAYVDDVEVSITFQPIHPFAGDVTARLVDPTGTRDKVLFGMVGSVVQFGCGDSSDLAGPYLISDDADPFANGFWEAATAAGAAEAIPARSYFATNSGGAGAVNPMPPTSLRAVFGGMRPEEAQGSWILRVFDSGGGDTGGVGAATLRLHLDVDTIFANGFD